MGRGGEFELVQHLRLIGMRQSGARTSDAKRVNACMEGRTHSRTNVLGCILILGFVTHVLCYEDLSEANKNEARKAVAWKAYLQNMLELDVTDENVKEVSSPCTRYAK